MKEKTIRQIPTGLDVYHSIFTIFSRENGEDREELSYLTVPFRSRLNHLLIGLFFNFNWDANEAVEITEEEYFALKHIFTSRKEYKLWKTAFEKLQKDGIPETKKWLIEQTKMLAVRNLLRNG